MIPWKPNNPLSHPFTSFHFQFCWLSFQHRFGLSSVDFFPADVEDGTCGVGSCSCGAWADMHCTKAASLNPYCLVAWRAMICNAWQSRNLIGLFGRIWIWGMFNGCSLGTSCHLCLFNCSILYDIVRQLFVFL